MAVRITSQDTLVGALNRQATELKRLVGTIDTHWECECGEHYVWPKNVWRCAICCFTQDECPDAIEAEMGGFRPTMGEPVFWQQFNKITKVCEECQGEGGFTSDGLTGRFSLSIECPECEGTGNATTTQEDLP